MIAVKLCVVGSVNSNIVSHQGCKKLRATSSFTLEVHNIFILIQFPHLSARERLHEGQVFLSNSAAPRCGCSMSLWRPASSSVGCVLLGQQHEGHTNVYCVLGVELLGPGHSLPPTTLLIITSTF